MTPLRGFLKKILGGASTSDSPTTTAARAPRARSTAPQDSPAVPAPDEGDRTDGRRRVTRGGRGRGGGTSEPTAQAQSAPPAAEPREATSSRGGRGRGRSTGDGAPASTNANAEPRAYAWTNRSGGDSNETEEQARQRREQASRQRRGTRTSFRPYRENLDAPLPEDIAFRSGPAGGDRSILPARRRRGTGLHDTERVIVGGARTLSGWSRPIGGSDDLVAPQPAHDAPHEREDEPQAEARTEQRPAVRRTRAPRVAEPAIVLDDDGELEAIRDATADEDADRAADLDATDTTEDGAAPRRRRGRRGGRGRRRPDGATDSATDDVDGAEISADGRQPDAPHSGAELDEARASTAVADTDLVEDDAPAYDLDALDDDDDLDEPIAAREERVGLDEEDDADDRDSEPHETAPARRAPRRPRAQADIDPSMFPEAFAALGVSDRTLQALARYGFATPTPIQERAIPALLNGRDVVGVAQTGSGKTIAFGIPMVEQLDPELAEVQGIVLVPTRELASQVLDVLRDLAAGFGLEAIGILGGHSLAGDFKALERRPAIVVGTPGRVIDHLQRGTLSLRYVRSAVLDEADQMLDIGFLPDIRRILSRTPKRRQTALFSATMPSTIRRLVWQFMDDPETVTVDPELSTVDTIDQVYFEVATRDKAKGLRELVQRELKGRTLVFCKMKRGVDRLEADLARQGVRVGALHGDMDQRRRDRVVQEFRNGELDVLIATNVAARGLDIPEITHVVNYDVPQNPEEYVHRIGRTGRAGRDGKAITFVSEWDMREWDAIASAFGDQLRREELSIYSS